jgi:hypothetical protein
MKLHFPTRLGAAVAFGGLVLALGTFAFRAQADVWDKKTVITVDQPIQVEDTYLEPGTYVFKLLESSSDRHIVQIYNREQNHLINTILAIPNYRLQPTGKSRFSFYEVPPGNAPAMHAWFYPGDNFGQEFTYPKQLHQLVAKVTKVTTVTQAQATTETTPAPVVTKSEEQQATATATQVAEQPKREEPVVIAQNTPPPAPQATPEPEPAPLDQPRELPHTATPYPLIGLLGVVSLAGYTFLRIKSIN